MPVSLQPPQAGVSSAIRRVCMVVLTAVACFSFPCVSARSQSTPVSITADHVNLRSCPGMACEVVVQVSTGDILQALGQQEGDWLAVVPPSNAVLWAHADLVQEDRAIVDNLRVRGGPGINYRPVAKLQKGDAVQVLGREGDWLRIAPPAGAALWVNVQYTRRMDADTGEAEIAGEGVPQEQDGRLQKLETVAPSTPVVEDVAVEVPALQQPAELPSLATTRRAHEGSALSESPTVGDGVAVRYEGTIKPVGLTIGRRPSRYRLMHADSLGRAVTRCYVVGDEKQLAAQEGRNVVIRGREAWIAGVRYPVVTLEALEPAR